MKRKTSLLNGFPYFPWKGINEISIPSLPETGLKTAHYKSLPMSFPLGSIVQMIKWFV